MDATTVVYSLMGLGFLSFVGEAVLKVIHKGEYVPYVKIATAAIAFATVITAVGVALDTASTVLHKFSPK
jgi:hypothetical protein